MRLRWTALGVLAVVTMLASGCGSSTHIRSAESHADHHRTLSLQYHGRKPVLYAVHRGHRIHCGSTGDFHSVLERLCRAPLL